MVDEGSTPIANLIGNGDLVINDGYRAKNSELSAEGLPFARARNINFATVHFFSSATNYTNFH